MDMEEVDLHDNKSSELDQSFTRTAAEAAMRIKFIYIALLFFLSLLALGSLYSDVFSNPFASSSSFSSINLKSFVPSMTHGGSRLRDLTEADQARERNDMEVSLEAQVEDKEINGIAQVIALNHLRLSQLRQLNQSEAFRAFQNTLFKAAVEKILQKQQNTTNVSAEQVDATTAKLGLSRLLKESLGVQFGGAELAKREREIEKQQAAEAAALQSGSTGAILQAIEGTGAAAAEATTVINTSSPNALIPSTTATAVDARHSWRVLTWQTCNRACGGGMQKGSKVVCFDLITLQDVDMMRCLTRNIPTPTQECNTQPCQPGQDPGTQAENNNNNNNEQTANNNQAVTTPTTTATSAFSAQSRLFASQYNGVHRGTSPAMSLYSLPWFVESTSSTVATEADSASIQLPPPLEQYKPYEDPTVASACDDYNSWASAGTNLCLKENDTGKCIYPNADYKCDLPLRGVFQASNQSLAGEFDRRKADDHGFPACKEFCCTTDWIKGSWLHRHFSPLTKAFTTDQLAPTKQHSAPAEDSTSKRCYLYDYQRLDMWRCMRGHRMVIVGDSMSRNIMRRLIGIARNERNPYDAQWHAWIRYRMGADWDDLGFMPSMSAADFPPVPPDFFEVIFIFWPQWKDLDVKTLSFLKPDVLVNSIQYWEADQEWGRDVGTADSPDYRRLLFEWIEKSYEAGNRPVQNLFWVGSQHEIPISKYAPIRNKIFKEWLADKFTGWRHKSPNSPNLHGDVDGYERFTKGYFIDTQMMASSSANWLKHPVQSRHWSCEAAKLPRKQGDDCFDYMNYNIVQTIFNVQCNARF